jgi:hypothetical protein
MSYSYVKTVFPDFKYSNVYDTKMYENLNVSQYNNKLFEPVSADVSTSYADINILNPEVIKEEKSKIETFKDNQQFYNLALPVSNIPTSNNLINKEKFQSNKDESHIEYTKHVLECSSCKELLMKQFNIENERIRNEEIMELISYLIFGLFILLLIDSYAKK